MAQASRTTTHYLPIHPDVYHYNEDFLEPKLVEALRVGTKEAILSVMDCPVFGVFRFPCLQRDFCERFIEELDALERSGVEMARPNSMNRYGAILDKCGFQALMADICSRMIAPIADLLFLHEGKQGLGLQHHHAFTVRYSATMGDRKLDKHVDNSDVTLNVCLGREGFKGGHLLFQGCKDSAVVRLPKKLHRYAAEEQENRVRQRAPPPVPRLH